METIRKSYKYRIFPSKSTKTLLKETLEKSRFTYNKILNTVIEYHKNNEEYLNGYDTRKLLPVMKKLHPEIEIVNSWALQNICDRIDKAFDAFFRRLKNRETPGFPRFKGKGRYHSYTLNSASGWKLWEDEPSKWKLRLSFGKNGCTKHGVKMHMHRPLPIGYKIQTVTISCERENEWYISFSCKAPSELLSTPKYKEVGIDLGLTTYGTLSDGTKIENPRFLKQSLKKLKKEQRKLSKQKTESQKSNDWKPYHKQKKKLSKAHKKVANQRKDWCHKVSRRLINDYYHISVENLDIKSMLESYEVEVNGFNINRSLHRSIADASWSFLLSCLNYKAENAGNRIVTSVDPRGTTQLCSSCGAYIRKGLEDRWHECPTCGLSCDRDHNASLNILALGRQGLVANAT